MMAYSEARPVARMLAAIADPTRLKIAGFLLAGPLHVGRIAELLGIPLVNVSHHLGVMRQAGLLEGEKQGRNVYYRFRDGVFAPGNGDGTCALLHLGPYRVHVAARRDSKNGRAPDAGH